MRFIRFGIISIIVFLTSCGISENIKPGADISLDEASAILVLGFSPDYRIHLLRGSLENNVWTRPGIDVPEVNIFPTNGYVIVKVKPTTPTNALGIGAIYLDYTGYGPCQDSISPVFELQGGSVNYVGHLSYAYKGKTLKYQSSIKNEEAKAYLEANYPSLARSLVYNPMRMLKVNSGFCNSTTITVPVYIN